ncbi:hypothetical protein ILUMI_13816 [Ignelater luminosus]|uniref:Peptidase S1 domain-containing protein n=1 Tax=Ignelater luminosus TaxID=2038154 RepID=A0A8K0CVG5_IGNLU|nr:hypothetical protein ILUMI_13816 [Ignelater luminosus]
MALVNYFQQEPFGILFANNQYVALFFKQGYYYMFDPHDRNLEGSSCESGTACVLKFQTLPNLVVKYLENVITMIDSIKCFAITLVTIGAISKSEQKTLDLGIEMGKGKKHCGATLIHWEYALTTAWCFIESTGPGISIRTVIEQLIEEDVINVCSPVLTRHGFEPVINSLKKIFVHPDYQCVPEVLGTRCLRYYGNDIAVVRLNRSMSEYRQYVFPIRLPSRRFLLTSYLNQCRRGILITGRRIKLARSEYDSCDLIRYISVHPLKERQISINDTSVRREKMFYWEVPSQKDYARYGDQGSPYVCYKRFCNVDTPFQYGLLARIRRYRKEKVVISSFEPVNDHIPFIAEYVPLKSFEMIQCRSGGSQKNPILLIIIYFICSLIICRIFVYINI